MKKVHLGKLLLESRRITQQQLDTAIEKQKKIGGKIGRILVDSGYITEDELLHLLSTQLNLPYVDLKNFSLDPKIVNLLPELYARRFRVIVLSSDEKGILVGMADPMDIVAVDELSNVLKRPIKIALVKEEDLLLMIDMMYRHSEEISYLADELSAELTTNDYDISQLGTGLSVADAPVVKLLQTLFEDAVKVNASDIHIEPGENLLRIRQRIDGVLHEQVIKEKRQIAQALTLRLKLMGGLNIAEKRLPQDGRFSIKIRNKNFDVRLSTMPTQYGESVVMRLLNHSAEMLSLDKIGMLPQILKPFRTLLSLPHGMILITGPTGSGKTTTLYGALTELNDAEKKIITVEDPVEYRIPRINQVQVQPKIELTFARVLRSVLRQDPDIIMIGELRDKETAGIAIRASMTGHLVLSTLHTNDAISSAVRLIDMGIEGYLVATVLRAILAQRLVRKICNYCKKDYKLSEQEKIWMEAIHSSLIDFTFQQGEGCAYCHNTGFKGQVGVFEWLEITPPLANALRLNDTLLFNKLAREQKDFNPLIVNGLDLVVRGVTTVSEIIRIMGEAVLYKE